MKHYENEPYPENKPSRSETGYLVIAWSSRKISRIAYNIADEKEIINDIRLMTEEGYILSSVYFDTKSQAKKVYNELKNALNIRRPERMNDETVTGIEEHLQ